MGPSREGRSITDECPAGSLPGGMLDTARRRSPAVPLTICFAAGILLDRYWAWDWVVWIMAGALAALGWYLAYRSKSPWASTLCLLSAAVLLGGARHHLFWSVRRADNVSRFARADRRPVRVMGCIVTSPWIRMKPKDHHYLSAWPQYDNSHCLLECRWLHTQQGRLQISGHVRLQVRGHLLHVEPGDVVDVRGMLARPSAPRNPGEFDYAEYLRGTGADGVLFADTPDAVRRLRTERTAWIERWSGRLRTRGEFVLVQHLRPQHFSIASALLLGSRNNMTDDLRDAFAQSGTLHLVALSGLHVGILALLLWSLCRALHLGPLATAALLLLIGVSFIFVTGARPSTVRAVIFLSVAGGAQLWHRRMLFENTLAVAALVLLMCRPGDLFDTGAQLSFLAVLAIWSVGRRLAQIDSDTPTVEAVIGNTHQGHSRLRKFTAFVGRAYRITFAVWLATLPLVAARFHLYAPVGLIINVLLIPVVFLVLWAGYGLLIFGILLPPAATPFGWICDCGLWLLLRVVETASGWRLGHAYGSAPAAWWMAGFYILLAAAMWPTRREPVRRLGRLALCLWIATGLSLALKPTPREGLRITYLSVGHGCSVLIELPAGGTVLYDAGSLQNGRYAARVVQSVLWERGVSRLDAIILSHADIDHFNAVPDVLQSVPVGSVLMANSFLDVEQPPVVTLCRSVAAAGVPVRRLSRGVRVPLDKAVAVHVLHPPSGAAASHDNLNSVVLVIEYAGRRFLLPGDLEGSGLQKLLREPIGKVDVLLAPHHGSLKANPPELAAWARPDWVVVSGGARVPVSALRDIYGPAGRVLSTAECGAVSFRVTADGDLQVGCHCHAAAHRPAAL